MNNNDQRLPVIYSTGAYLKPFMTFSADGECIWIWQVIDFCESSYENGLEVEPKVLALNIGGLFSENK